MTQPASGIGAVAVPRLVATGHEITLVGGFQGQVQVLGEIDAQVIGLSHSPTFSPCSSTVIVMPAAAKVIVPV